MTRPRRQPAFTLLEMMVALGAVALMSVGIAQVFRATSETVRIGRRLSRLNEYAGLLERQMRADFAAMSRDGFVLIRNQEAAGTVNGVLSDHGVRLSRDQADAYCRTRRCDEIVFFASGEFYSQRDPVHPQRVPRSTAARVYYGHGWSDDPSATQAFYSNDPTPLTHAVNATVDFGQPGPNQTAADWNLLRHITLLCQPGETFQDALTAPPVTGRADLAASRIPDNEIQIALEPAVASIFRGLSTVEPVPMPALNALVRTANGEPISRPQFSSGMVDIATDDLGSIRAVIMDAQPLNTGAPFNLDADLAADGVNGAVFDPDPNFGTGTPAGNMQDWMRLALPASSDTPQRVRCQRTPPDYLGVVDPNGTRHTDSERTDQVMLSSNILAPACTEFIVEWSFGDVINAPGSPYDGQTVWHGMRRDQVVNPNVSPQATVVAAWPYGVPPGGATGITNDDYRFHYRLRNGAPALPGRLVQPLLIHTANSAGRALYSYFGYVDPTFTPAANAPNEPDAIPWVWPRLIRVTLSLTDPATPTFEQTYQFVFETPGDGESL